MERLRVLAEDLREVNRHRRKRSDAERARLFRAHCLCCLRELAESSGECRDFSEALHRAERGLITMEASDGEVLTQQIDRSLEHFSEELHRLGSEALDRDRRKMEELPFQQICGAVASPHRKLVTVHVQTLSGAEFRVRCSSDAAQGFLACAFVQ